MVGWKRTCAPKRLDGILHEFIDDSPDSSVLFSDAPVTSIIQRRQFQALCALTACMYGTLGSFWIRRAQSNGVHMFQHYRLTVLELRSHAACVRSRRRGAGGEPTPGGQNASDEKSWRENGRVVQLGHFGMLYNSRDARYRMHGERKLSQQWERGALLTSFDEPVPSNGFYFVTAAEGSDEACDPIRFAVHGTNLLPSADGKCVPAVNTSFGGDASEGSLSEGSLRACRSASEDRTAATAGAEWTQVGSSSFAFDHRPPQVRRDSFIYVFEDGEFGTSSARGHLHAFDLSSPVFKIGICALSCLACAIGTASATVFGLMRQPKRGRALLSQAILVNFITHLLQIPFRGRHVIAHVICSGSCVALCFFGDNRNFCRYAFLTFCAWALVGFFGNNGYLGIIGFLGALYWGKSLLSWRMLKAASASIVQSDMAQYNKVWYLLLKEPHMQAALDAIQASCHRLPGGSGPCPAPQHRFQPAEGFNTVRDEGWERGRGREETGLRCRPDGVEIFSLDHAYAQAAVVRPMLIAKVENLALHCRGSFLCQFPDGHREYVLWKSLASREYVREGCGSSYSGEGVVHPMLLLPALKKADRAIQKAVRCYTRNASYLVDICRHSVVFERPEDLGESLVLLTDDPEIEVVRVKNRLHASYDAISTAGYRDVLVNGRFKNDTVVRLGVDRHIFEILLILRPFADLKTEEGHRNYKLYRDLRGQ